MLRVVNVAEALGRFEEAWKPHIAGQVNDMQVKVVKFRGEFVWHHHEREDEMFLVVKGTMRLRTRDGDLRIKEGEFVIVPKGVEHCPAAEGEVHVLLFEPATTLNTGNVRNERTREALDAV
ncbi:MAG TPA: cupin domain-containing protein [Candidatus Thermoplasmatota archaeon]|jgi:mannose-6-phosphate isomerase-like protein (cupin superfamily)|nr:cupin domain-containing protein [Candidatus Thermoplasmatota archaeon]